MRDSELEFNGKSKTISTPEMPDTYAEFKSMVEGGDFTADVVTNPDGYIEFGTPYSKNTVLPDTVATDLGLSGDATIADALGKMIKCKVVPCSVNEEIAGNGTLWKSYATYSDIPENRVIGLWFKCAYGNNRQNVHVVSMTTSTGLTLIFHNVGSATALTNHTMYVLYI